MGNRFFEMRYFTLLFLSFFIFSFTSYGNVSSEEKSGEEEKPFDQMGMVMHHIADSHSWVVYSSEGEDGHHSELVIPLPVIFIDNGALHIFLSSRFTESKNGVVESKGGYYLLTHNKIYKTGSKGSVSLDNDHHITNDRVFDISFTRNVASMWISIAIILAIFIPMARRYRSGIAAPKGVQSLFEPIVLFVRDDIVYTQIGKKHSDRFLPYLMTIFFFIWLNNLLGLIPFFPGGSNLSGNIAFALVLAFCTFVITNISGSKTYWKHILTAPGIPGFVKPIMVPVEILSIFTKPFALMIRLFANITAGHMLILSLVSMIFVFKSIYVAPPSVLIVIAMSVLELFVGLLQAYIFTLLSALFIGMAIQEDDHH